MEKPKVGQILYSLNIGNAARYKKQELTPVKVTKIGRKYFTCVPVDSKLSWMEQQYHLDDWGEKTDYLASSALYENEQKWIDKKESDSICKEIADAFQYGRNHNKVSLENLRIIKNLLNE